MAKGVIRAESLFWVPSQCEREASQFAGSGYLFLHANLTSPLPPAVGSHEEFGIVRYLGHLSTKPLR
jgi:hypothetical protein